MKPTLWNIIGAGLWAASAVKVTGYTWQAMRGEYEQFPTMGGSAQPQSRVTRAANSAANTSAAGQTGPFGWLSRWAFGAGKNVGDSLGLNHLFGTSHPRPMPPSNPAVPGGAYGGK